MNKDLTFREFGIVFEQYQKLFPDAPYMEARFNAYDGSNPRVGIYYTDGCFWSSTRFENVNELYDLMRMAIASHV